MFKYNISLPKKKADDCYSKKSIIFAVTNH